MGLVEGMEDLKTVSEVLGIEFLEVSPLGNICSEMVRGRDKFGKYNSRHEGLGVIVEEFEEFKDAIRSNDNELTSNEAKQLAAVAMRFYLEFRC